MRPPFFVIPPSSKPADFDRRKLLLSYLLQTQNVRSASPWDWTYSVVRQKNDGRCYSSEPSIYRTHKISQKEPFQISLFRFLLTSPRRGDCHDSRAHRARQHLDTHRSCHCGRQAGVHRRSGRRRQQSDVGHKAEVVVWWLTDAVADA